MDNNTKNLVVAVFLMLGVWFLYMTFVQPEVQPEPEVAGVEKAQVNQKQTATSSPSLSTPDRDVVIKDVVIKDVKEQDLTVETDLYIATFSNVLISARTRVAASSNSIAIAAPVPSPSLKPRSIIGVTPKRSCMNLCPISTDL